MRDARWLCAALGLSASASAGVIYRLDATNISFTIPSALFTNANVTGFLEIADGISLFAAGLVGADAMRCPRTRRS